MKNVMLCGAAILLMMPGAAFAEQGAVEGAVLHIEALGEVPADMARLSASVSADGASQAAADAALAAKKAEITGKLTALGIGAADVVWLPSKVTASPGRGMGKKPAEQPSESDAVAGLAVTLRDLSNLPQVTAALSGEGVNFFGANQTAFLASDPTAAHSRAVALALAHAQAEAESYAGAMHRHVGAALRVANTKPAINLPDVVALFAHMDSGNNPMAKMAMSTTTAAVQVDYQLLP